MRRLCYGIRVVLILVEFVIRQVHNIRHILLVRVLRVIILFTLGQSGFRGPPKIAFTEIGGLPCRISFVRLAISAESPTDICEDLVFQWNRNGFDLGEAWIVGGEARVCLSCE